MIAALFAGRLLTLLVDGSMVDNAKLIIVYGRLYHTIIKILYYNQYDILQSRFCTIIRILYNNQDTIL